MAPTSTCFSTASASAAAPARNARDSMLGDMNGDDRVNGAVVDPFFECLGSGVCPWAVSDSGP